MKEKIGIKTLGKAPAAFVMWDTEVKGFFARRQTEAGQISYGFRYTDATGAKREIKIGIHGALTPDQARTAAQARAGEIAKSEDPAAVRDALRAVKTLEQIWADYETLTLPKTKGKTAPHFRSIWKNYLGPLLGAKRGDAITKNDVERMHQAITMTKPLAAVFRFLRGPTGYRKGARGGSSRGGPIIANHAVELLSLLLNDAGLPNPCEKVRRHKANGRDVHFSDTELNFILLALEEASLREQCAFGLFLETANRHQTIAGAEWEEFADLDPRFTNNQAQWLVFGEKLKGGRPQSNFISPTLAALILKLKGDTYEDSPRYLFPFGEGKRNGAAVAAFDPSRPRRTLDSVWERLKARALALAEAQGVTDLRGLRLGTIHTFKHTFLTRFADLGASAIEVKQAGDHKDIRTSMRYIKASGERMQALQGEMARRLPRAASL